MSGNKFVPLTFDLIEEGEFLAAVNDGIERLQHDLVEHVDAWRDRAAKSKAQLKIEINLGPDDLVVYKTMRTGTERYNFNFRRSGNREYVCGWDERTAWVDEIRNYRTKPIRFELRRQWRGHVDYSSEIETKLFDYHTIEATFDVPERGKKLYPCTVVTHNGTNKKQERIELKKVSK